MARISTFIYKASKTSSKKPCQTTRFSAKLKKGWALSTFDFGSAPTTAEWAVDSLFPEGHLCLVLAQAGVGKSLLVEALAVSVVHGIPFAGFPSIEGEVLIIDQDTPTDVLHRRLLKFGLGLGLSPKYELHIESMGGYSLADGTLASIINQYPNTRLVIIDCLHSVCGRLNPNYTSDMNHWAKLKSKCLNGHNTILLNHHISQKNDMDIDALMQGEPNRLAMGSSAIMQQADSYYIVGAKAHEGRAQRIYIRPVSKRVSIKTSPVILNLVEQDNGEVLEYDGLYEPDLDETEYDIIILFTEQRMDRTVKEVYEAMGHKHGEKLVRTALASLEKKGKLKMSRHKSNLFRYRIA